jgi:hypothetical protein
MAENPCNDLFEIVHASARDTGTQPEGITTLSDAFSEAGK